MSLNITVWMLIIFLHPSRNGIYNTPLNVSCFGLTGLSPICAALFFRPFVCHLRVLWSASELFSVKDWLKDGRCGDTLAGGLIWTRCPRLHGASNRWPVSSLVCDYLTVMSCMCFVPCVLYAMSGRLIVRPDHRPLLASAIRQKGY